MFPLCHLCLCSHHSQLKIIRSHSVFWQFLAFVLLLSLSLTVFKLHQHHHQHHQQQQQQQRRHTVCVVGCVLTRLTDDGWFGTHFHTKTFFSYIELLCANSILHRFSMHCSVYCVASLGSHGHQQQFFVDTLSLSLCWISWIMWIWWIFHLWFLRFRWCLLIGVQFSKWSFSRSFSSIYRLLFNFLLNVRFHSFHCTRYKQLKSNVY